MLTSLWLYGDTKAVGLLQQHYHEQLDQPTPPKRQKIWERSNRCPRVNLVCQIFWGKNLTGQRIKWTVKDLGDHKAPADDPSYSVAAELSKCIRSHEILLLQPVAKDGHTTHAVCIVKNWEVRCVHRPCCAVGDVWVAAHARRTRISWTALSRMHLS